MIKDVKEILSKLRYILTAKQKIEYVFVAIVIFIGSMLELLGVAAVSPFMDALENPDSIDGKWYMNILGKFFNPKTTLETITILGILIIIIYFLKNLFLCFSTYIQAKFSTAVQKEVQIKMVNTYLSSSYLFFLGVNSSVLIRNVTQDVVGVFAECYYLSRAFAEMFTIVAISAYIVFLDPFLALFMVVILGTCMIIMSIGLKKVIRRYGKTCKEMDGKMIQYLTQAFNGIKEVMVSKRQDHFAGVFEDTSIENARACKKNNFFNNIPLYIYEFLCIGGLMAVVIIRLNMLSDTTEFVTKLAVIAVAAFRLFPSTGRLTTSFNMVTFNKPRLEAIYDLLHDAVFSRPEALVNYEDKKDETFDFKDEIKLENISWQYPLGKEPVLENLSMTVKKGTSVALIGPSGAGKTTLADVILGLLKPQGGSVMLDGQDVYEHPYAWSRIIGYVPQNVFLTDDTVRANVAFGIKESEVDESKIWRALRDAQLEQFVKDLPEGLDTMVGERGVRLSGGQRQRIAIARALYENPEILILDEATSALDNDTETAVMEAIDKLHGSKTMIIVAHRLSTIRNCDAIYEIKDKKATIKDKNEVLA